MAKMQTIIDALLSVGKSRRALAIEDAIKQAKAGEKKVAGFTLGEDINRDELISNLDNHLSGLKQKSQYQPTVVTYTEEQLRKMRNDNLLAAEERAKKQAKLDELRNNLPSVESAYPHLSEYPVDVQNDVKSQYDYYKRSYPENSRDYKKDIEKTLDASSPQVAKSYLENAGYRLAVESPKSESLYFNHPDVPNKLLRISGHELPDNPVMGYRDSGLVLSGKSSIHDQLKEMLGSADSGYDFWPKVPALLAGGGALAAASSANAATPFSGGLMGSIAQEHPQPVGGGLLGAFLQDSYAQGGGQTLSPLAQSLAGPQQEPLASRLADFLMSAQIPNKKLWQGMGRQLPEAARQVGDLVVENAVPLWLDAIGPRPAY